jgi:molybdate transport system substrate-binding protein
VTRTSRLAAALPVGLLFLAACGGDGGGQRDGQLTVFAASSLTEAFQRIGEGFAAANPGVDVRFSFGASSSLAQQVAAGAAADVFAAASPATMTVAVDAGEAVEPQVFARNRLEIAVPPSDPGGVTGLADFARPELMLALCAEQVPCGAAAQQVLADAGVTPAPDTLESDARAALSKVRLGEVDAALVYHSDVLAAGESVRGVPFPEAAGAGNDYLIAPLAEAPNAEAARAFTAYVLSDDAQRVLADAGFEAP